MPCRYFFVERIIDAEEDVDRYEEQDIKVAVEGVREDEGGSGWRWKEERMEGKRI